MFGHIDRNGFGRVLRSRREVAKSQFGREKDARVGKWGELPESPTPHRMPILRRC